MFRTRRQAGRVCVGSSLTLCLMTLVLLCGCQSLAELAKNRVIEPWRIFNKWGPTGESRRIIDSPGHLGVRPHAPAPDLPMYQAGGLVEDTVDKRLYYTCQYIEPEALRQILCEQLSGKYVDINALKKKGTYELIPGVVISVNPSTNQIIVSDPSWTKIEQIKGLIARIDRAPPQVRIDALIEEVFADMTEDYSIDVDLSYAGEDTDVLLNYGLPGASVRWPGRAGQGVELTLDDVTGGRTDIEVILNFLRSEGLARDLSRPSLLVANRQTATVENTESIPIVEEIIQGSNVVKTIKYKDVKTLLEVTPTVLSDNRISLRYKIQVASAKPEGPSQAPVITSKKTEVRETILRHGESLIVAGILYRKRLDIVRAVPILGEIPILDLVFSTKDHEDRWFEIVFVLTPYIVDSETKSPFRFRSPNQAYPRDPFSKRRP